MSDNVFTVLRASMPDPARRFLETADGTVLTYGDLLARSARIANVLVGAGVAPGDRVAAQVEKSPQALMLYLGCVRAGAVFLPLNSGYTEAELEYFFGDAEPAMVVCDPARHASIAAIAVGTGSARVLTLAADGSGSLTEAAATASADFDDVARDRDDLAAMLYTSGTTGRPKGAMLTHGNLVSNAQALVEYWRFGSDDVLLHALPIFHTHGLFVATNVTLLAGASMLFLPGFDRAQVLRLLPRATVMMGVPTFYVRLLAGAELTAELVAHMRVFVSGSAPLSAEIHREFHERTGHAILERYGMTETNMNTSNPYDGERRAGTVGFPLPGVEIRIADRETGAALPAGEVGVIEVRGPNVFNGYWRMPEKTAAEFREDGFFISGDLGRIDERGYLHIVGRDKDLIITGGYNVYPAEIEAAIDAIEGVGESAVIGLPHRDFGEGVTAVVAQRPGAALEEKAMRNELEQVLAKYKVPKRVFFVDKLPRNAMGKIEKKTLREQYAGTYAG